MFIVACVLGFNAVELSSEFFEADIDSLVAAKEKANVEVVLLNTKEKLAAISGREVDFQEDFELTCDYATALCCSKIHLMAGALNTPMDWNNSEWQQAKVAYISNVKYAAEKCSQKNITLLLEAVTSIPNYFVQYQQDVADIVRMVNRDNVKLQFDFYHAQKKGGNLYEFLTKNIDIIGHVQVSQVPGRHEPDMSGEINCPFIFQTLKDLNYCGWLGCEYLPRGIYKIFYFYYIQWNVLIRIPMIGNFPNVEYFLFILIFQRI
jgi:hydroxypyruvate isomerase